MEFKDNLDYIEAYNDGHNVFYMPSELTNYHKSREIAMRAQDMYSRCGISREVLTSFADTMLELVNNEGKDRIRSEVAVLAANLKFRMSSPVDELCCLRMGAIACFIEGEDPEKVAESWTAQKMRMAEKNPDIYAFFLNTGIGFSPEYQELLRSLTAEEYFQTRKQMLSGMMPESIRVTS